MHYEFVSENDLQVILRIKGPRMTWQDEGYRANPDLDSIITVTTDEYYSSPRFFTCDCCGDICDDDEDDRGFVGSDLLCRDCFEEETTYCSNCDEIGYTEDMVYCDQTDEYYCQHCADTHLIWCYGHERYEVEDDDRCFYEIDGDLYCEYYCDNHFHWCAGHEEYEDDDDMYWVGDDLYCEDYCNDHFFWCAGHEGYENPDDTDYFEVNGEYFCEEYCEDSDYMVYCYECDSYYDIDSMYMWYEDEDGNPLSDPICNSCYHGHDLVSNRYGRSRTNINYRYASQSSPNLIKGYHCHSDREKALMLDSDSRKNFVHMGFELEVFNPNITSHTPNEDAKAIHDIIGDYACFERDGSLCVNGGGGFEIITRPGSLREHMSRFEKTRQMCKELVSRGYNSHNSNVCGLHIHIDRAYFGEVYNSKVQDLANAKFLYIFERHWDNLVRFSRRDKFKYCLKAPKMESEYDRNMRATVTKMLSIAKLATVKKSLSGHGYAVNITSINQNTIEIRLWRGSLLPETILATLKFTARLAEIVKTKTVCEISKMNFMDILGDDEDILSYWETVKSRPVPTE